MAITQDGFTVAVYNSNWAEISSAQLGETIYITLAAPATLQGWICEISDVYDDRFLPNSEDVDTRDITFTWTIPTDIIPNFMSREYTIYIYASTGNSYGDPSTRFYIPLTINVPEYTVDPPTVTMSNSLTQTSYYYQNLSTVTVKAYPPPLHYGTIHSILSVGYYAPGSTSISHILEGEFNNPNPINRWLELKYPGDYTFVFDYSDWRGKTSSTTRIINVREYSFPSISLIDTYRCTPEGERDEEFGTCLYYNISYFLTNDDVVLNGKKLSLFWKVTTSTEYTSIDIPINTSTGTISGIIDTPSFSPEHNYYIYAAVSDTFRTVLSDTKTIAAYSVLLDFRADGKGFSVGKIATTQADPLFEVAWPSRFYDTAVFQKGDGWIGPRSVRSVDGANYRAEMGVGSGKSAALEFAPVGDSVKNRIDLFADRTELYQPLLANSGGTGRKSLTSGYFLRGNGTGAVTLSSPSDALIDMGGALGETGYVDDLNTCHYRGLYACSSSTKNTPDGGYGACVSIPFWTGTETSARKQLYIVHGDNMTIYQRYRTANGTWSAWTTNYGSSYQQEVGTWTPSLYFPNADMGTLSYTRWGYYVKTGRSITISWALRFTTTSQGWLQQEDYPRIAGIPYLPYGGHYSSAGQTVIIPGRGRTDQTVSFIAYANNHQLAIQEQNGWNVSMKPSYIGDFWLDGSITYIGY